MVVCSIELAKVLQLVEHSVFLPYLYTAMSNKLVTIKTFTYPYEAHILMGRLESEGILCYLQDELTVQMMPFHSNALGGVKLQIREKDVELALKILEDAENSTLDNIDFQSQDCERDGTEIHKEKKSRLQVTCPICHSSEEVDKPIFSEGVFAISYLILGFPLPFPKKKYYCYHCRKEFRKR
jgi:hypothetical protein